MWVVGTTACVFDLLQVCGIRYGLRGFYEKEFKPVQLEDSMVETIHLKVGHAKEDGRNVSTPWDVVDSLRLFHVSLRALFRSVYRFVLRFVLCCLVLCVLRLLDTSCMHIFLQARGRLYCHKVVDFLPEMCCVHLFPH